MLKRSKSSRMPISAAAALACAAVFIGCDNDSAKPPPSPPKRITIVTPHNDAIRSAFSIGFSNWHDKKYGNSVYINWVVRGTPECVSYVESVGQSADRESRREADVMFGGGINDHQLLAEHKLSRALKIDDALKDIPATVGGLPTRDPAGNWFATGLSSFGILYNDRASAQRGIAPPQTWEDLADPRFFSWIGVADPDASGSHLQCMVLILQKYGWQDGWSRLIRILANGRALVERSAAALRQTQNGVFLATFAVNFDGIAAQHETRDAVKYVHPLGATSATPDVVSALQSASDPALAEAFVRYCLTEDAQMLWGLQPESDAGDALYHYPILPAVYEKHAARLSVKENPFKADFGLQYDVAKAADESRILAPLVESACRDNHVLLQQAWQAVIAAKMPPAAVAELTSPPFDEKTAFELGRKFKDAAPQDAEKLRADWSAAFAAKYKKVLELAKG